MSMTTSYGVYKIQPDTYTFQTKKMVEVIREVSQARMIFEVGPKLPVWQVKGQYFEESEQNNVQYNLDLVEPLYSAFAALERNPKIPIHQCDLKYFRHELKAVQGDILKLDRRQRLGLEQMADDENRVLIAGDTKTGITSFADTTNNSTAYTASLDLTSYATFITTWNGSLSQIRNLLKNKWAGSQPVQVWTTDVDDRARACLNTDENDTAFDWLVRKIGEKNIVATNYLGSEANSGTTNAALVPKSHSNSEIMGSGIEHVSGLTPLKDYVVQFALRSRPVFYRGVKSCLYDASVDITP